MSMTLMVAAMNAKVGNPLRKLVLIKLADNANDYGECWPSYQHIADHCEIARSTVKNHVRELEKSGFLVREYRRDGKINRSNVFHLTIGNGARSSRAPDNLGHQITQGGAPDNPGGGAPDNPRTSHSLEPVKEPLVDSGEIDVEASAIKSKKTKLPACPIDTIINLWSEIMPDKKQPLVSIWKQGQNGVNLSNRWKQCFSIQHSREDRKLYHDLDSGIEFWRLLFQHLRRSEFLMADDRNFFGLDWIVKKANFEKILEGKYHA